MNSAEIEFYLAKLYTDSNLLDLFLQAPEVAMKREGISSDSIQHLMQMDKAGLIMAANSYSLKRKDHTNPSNEVKKFFNTLFKRIKKW